MTTHEVTHTKDLPFISQNNYYIAEWQEGKQVAMETGARTNTVWLKAKVSLPTSRTIAFFLAGVAIFFFFSFKKGTITDMQLLYCKCHNRPVTKSTLDTFKIRFSLYALKSKRLQKKLNYSQHFWTLIGSVSVNQLNCVICGFRIIRLSSKDVYHNVWFALLELKIIVEQYLSHES